ncbi:hypothetical protein CYMTET_34435 [Cymbomonas tetramitiformis]|uniref:Uncharacterized protein n=1 Tax=Cymbomonas tetramitiformis TaxID=36881 RepID=A0AAE0FB72_9CHLO|nr:hypothetical protein CYMTET_34435 [Cymbomonas tetramitiformis]
MESDEKMMCDTYSEAVQVSSLDEASEKAAAGGFVGYGFSSFVGKALLFNSSECASPEALGDFADDWHIYKTDACGLSNSTAPSSDNSSTPIEVESVFCRKSPLKQKCKDDKDDGAPYFHLDQQQKAQCAQRLCCGAPVPELELVRHEELCCERPLALPTAPKAPSPAQAVLWRPGCLGRELTCTPGCAAAPLAASTLSPVRSEQCYGAGYRS